ncbi:MAG: family 43 glycosylhydrolase [Bacilli bacterium]|nr:family 43 glycosylhydrolase [Bacilli bacterium]MBR1582067.1 family 43 glycosylhydrolase [Bacilli bacterium]
MKRKGLFFTIITLLIGTLTGCSGKNLLDYVNYNNLDKNDRLNYNGDLFYRNDLVTTAPDPSVIMVDDGFGKNIFYMYATSNEINGTGVQVWKSYDLNAWECQGIAFSPEEASWCHRDIWAPEVLPYEGKYYMCFSGRNNNDPQNRLSLNLAIADKPTGPFIQYSGINSDGRTVGLGDVWVPNNLFDEKLTVYGQEMIDADLFVDDDGEIYLYFCSTSDSEGSSIWGIHMKDMFTPDYSTATKLLRTRRKNVDDLSQTLTIVDENYTNEGPFMIKEDGQYYLTFSVHDFRSKNYSVKQAIGTSPLGKFTKVDLNHGGKILAAVENQDGRYYTNESGKRIAIDDYDQMSGTGHHCFLRVDNQLYCIYHAHIDRAYGGGSERAVAIDKVHFIKNDIGEKIMYINGPTWSIQPLPKKVSGYENIAPLASVRAKNTRSSSSVHYLNDDLIKMHNDSMVNDYVAERGTTIKLTLPEYYNVTAVLVYNSFYYDKLWEKVDQIQFKTDKNLVGHSKLTIENIYYDHNWGVDEEWQFVRAGQAAIAEFNEIPVKEVSIKINSKKPIAIGDICILGRPLNEHKGSYDLRNHKINPPVYSSFDWRDIQLDEGIVIDGDVTEEEYKGNRWLDFGGIISDDYNCKFTTKIGEEGVYFAAIITDPFVSWNPAKALYQNSSLEIQFCESSISTVSYNVLQLRVGCNGTIEQYRGFYSGHGLVKDSYRWTISSYPAMARTKGLGFDIKHLQKNVDVSNVQGYSVEAYVPFNVFTTSDSLDNFHVLPTFNTLPNFTSTNRTSNVPYGIPFDAVGSYFTFGNDGLENVLDNENLGSLKNRITTTGFDISHDEGENPYAIAQAPDQQYAFFKNVYSTSFVVSTNITINQVYQNDSYPKFGLISYTDSQTLFYCIEAPGLTNNKPTMAFTGGLGTGDWNWNEIGSYTYNSVSTGSYTGNDSVKLTMVRQGPNFYFFVNDTYAGKREGVPGFSTNFKSYPGFLCMNIGAKFFNYEASTDEAKINSYMSKVN